MTLMTIENQDAKPAEAPPTQSTSAPVQNTATTEQVADFNPADLESAYGLPPGFLSDAKDESDAIAAVRQFTDRTLTAGIGLEQYVFGEQPPAVETPVPQPPALPTTAEKLSAKEAAKTEEASELAQLKSQMKALTDHIVGQTKMQHEQVKAELRRRMTSKVDSWNSPKYGSSKSRSYKQQRAVNEFEQMVMTSVAGLQQFGQPVPTIEVIMERLHLYDDPEAKPAKSAEKQAPVGTPGTRNKATGQDVPRSIHHALQQNPT
jgi:hypothetical protein